MPMQVCEARRSDAEGVMLFIDPWHGGTPEGYFHVACDPADTFDERLRAGRDRLERVIETEQARADQEKRERWESMRTWQDVRPLIDARTVESGPVKVGGLRAHIVHCPVELPHLPPAVILEGPLVKVLGKGTEPLGVCIGLEDADQLAADNAQEIPQEILDRRPIEEKFLA